MGYAHRYHLGLSALFIAGKSHAIEDSFLIGHFNNFRSQDQLMFDRCRSQVFDIQQTGGIPNGVIRVKRTARSPVGIGDGRANTMAVNNSSDYTPIENMPGASHVIRPGLEIAN